MRWGALAVVSFTMMAAYFVNDVMMPLKSMLESELSWSSTEFGTYAGAYSFLNVFLLMLLWGGLILDRFGVRFTGKLGPVLAGGAAAMDTCLPVVAHVSGERCAILAVFSGMCLTLLVPFLLPVIMMFR